MPEVERLLSKEQVSWLIGNRHMPNAASREIASLLAVACSQGMDGFAFHAAEKQRATLVDHLGGCERILKTPLARASAIQVRQFIFIFLLTLPFAISDDFESPLFNTVLGVNEWHRMWTVPLFVMLLGYMLLALDRIGMELQNPFDPGRLDFLPLDEICMTIEQNLLELLHEDSLHDYPAPTVSDVCLPPDASAGATDGDLTADIS